MKKYILFLGLIGLVSLLYGQSTTNNNTIIIQGNVYYFQPSNTPSSPLPRTGNSNFIGTVSWYGENAARAWASISDWAVERCITSSSPVRGNNNERVYISQVHAYRILANSNSITEEAKRHDYNDMIYTRGDTNGITIYYWVVRNGDLMENGRRAKRIFVF